MSKLRNLASILGLSALMGLAGVAPSAAQPVTIGVNEQGSLSFVAGAAVARVVSSETDLVARTQSLSGSTSFIPMLDRGEVLVGFSSATEFVWAYNGIETFEGREPAKNLRFVGMMFPLYAGVAVAGDSPLRSLEDLAKHDPKSLRVTSGYPSLKTLERYLRTGFKAAGVNFDDFVQVPVAGLNQGIEALGDNRTDITWVAVGSAAGQQADVALASRGGWRFIDMVDTEEGNRLWQEVFPGTSFVTVHNPAQPGVREPVKLQQLPFMMVANASASDETIYKITKALIENQEKLASMMPNFKGLDTSKMALIPGLPYHPGALRAYAEAGIETLPQ